MFYINRNGSISIIKYHLRVSSSKGCIVLRAKFNNFYFNLLVSIGDIGIYPELTLFSIGEQSILNK